MKQKIVIEVSMPCDKSRSKAMALAAGAAGVSSVGITGDNKNRLELVGYGVDSVCLARCLRRKFGHADILQVEEVKDEKPEVKKKPDESKPTVVHPLPQCCPGYYCHHHYPPPPQVVVCDEPSTCSVM